MATDYTIPKEEYRALVEERDKLFALLKHESEQNAKLRELVDYMTPIAWYAASEYERDRMRELGVEVDG